MSYIVTNTRGQIIAVVQDGTVNTTATSQTLIGKNVTPFGQFAVENLVHQLENFANSTSPGNPIEGQIWYDTSEEKAYQWSGEEWKPVSGLTVSESEPELDPRSGDLWFNPVSRQLEVYSPLDSGAGWIPVSKVTVSSIEPTGQTSGELYYNTISRQLFAFDGTLWNLIGPEAVSGFATTRWVSTTLLDTGNVPRAVIQGTVNGVITAIVSSLAFTIREDQRPEGFTALVSGINLASGSVLSGIATQADKLTTARTINGVSFDGTANILIGNPGSLTAGAYIDGDAYSGTQPVTWNIDASANNEINKIVARDAQGDFAAGTITANLNGSVTGTASNITGIAAVANGGTGRGSFVPGQLLLGASNGSLIPVSITGADPISITANDSGVSVSYTGGAGIGTVTEVGLITSGDGLNIEGSPITAAGNIVITNTGVTRLNAGAGVSVDRINGNVTVTNTGVTRLIAGPNTAISPTSGIGEVTVSALATTAGVARIIAGPSADPQVDPDASAIAISPSDGQGTVTLSIPDIVYTVVGGDAVAVDTVRSGKGKQVTVRNTGVFQINAGSGISISATEGGGRGIVTINATGGGGGAVNRIIAGSNITVSPANGQGDVTISASGGGGGGTVTRINAGDGLRVTPAIIGGNITTVGTMAVDNTVVRTAGDQDIRGVKSFLTLEGGGFIAQAQNYVATGVSTFWQPTEKYVALSVGEGQSAGVTKILVGDNNSPGPNFARNILFSGRGNLTEIFFAGFGSALISGSGQSLPLFGPANSGGVALGSPTYRWSTVYTQTAPNVSSDRRLKSHIADSDLGLDFVRKLRPVKYQLSNTVPQPDQDATLDDIGMAKMNMDKATIEVGVRSHYGLVGQEVKQILDDIGVGDRFAGWSLSDRNDPDSSQSLSYEQFIAPLIRAVQELSEQVDQLRQQLNDPK